jgi:uncharacterized protein (DUF885 family)
LRALHRERGAFRQRRLAPAGADVFVGRMSFRHRFLTAALGGFTVLSGAPVYTPEQIAAESAKANAFFERTFEASAQRSPIFLTQLGQKDKYDQWDDFSELKQAEDLALIAAWQHELKRDIDFAALDEQTKVSYRMWIASAEQAAEAWRWRHHGYVFSQMGGMHTDAPAFLINFHSVDNVADARAYLARLRGLARAFDQLTANARAAQARGVLPPIFVFPLLIEAAREVVTGAPFDQSGKPSALLADIEGKIAALKDAGDTEKKQLLADATAALTGAVQPAYAKLIAMFEEQHAVATDDDGVWKLPHGRDYYNFMLRQHTTTNLGADEIHELGLREVARIHREMTAIKEKVGFQGDLAAFLRFTRDDPQFSFPTTEEGKAEYVRRATAVIDRMKARLPEFFTVFPKADLVVKKVEPFRERGSAAAFYDPPSADGTRPGAYYVNTIDMRGLPIWEIETLAHHEAIPGHHMQIAIAQELEGIPRFRKFGGFTAYSEGWALYTEYFPKEFGFYADPMQDFGRLADELLRAVRLVVDTGVHAKRWTRAQVMDYFRANTPQSERDLFTETNRYIVWPGQATSYKVGMLKILELRERAKNELGAKFDLRAYHDLVLKNGAVPMGILEENVQAWVAKTK